MREDTAPAAVGDEFARPGAWISRGVLVEAAWAVKTVYRVRAARIADAIEMLLDHESLVVEESEVVAAAVARVHEPPRVGSPDCLTLETARKAGHLPLGTFDLELGKLDGAERL